jgi:hypothetical protein
MHPVGDFLFRPQDLGFKLVADLQLVFDQIFEPVTHRLFLIQSELFEGGFDFLDTAHRTHCGRMELKLQVFSGFQATELSTNTTGEFL